MAVDFSDPCARYAALRDAYYNLISGAGESLIRYKGPEGEREVRFHTVNVNFLRSEMQTAQAECTALTNGTNPNRRFAIRAGARQSGVAPSDWWTRLGQFGP